MRQPVAIIVLALLLVLSSALAACTTDVLVGERAPDADTDACALDADAPDACGADADASDADGPDADARSGR